MSIITPSDTIQATIVKTFLNISSSLHMDMENINDHDCSSLVSHYENCLTHHGPTPQGVDWPNAADLTTRYRIMLEVIRITNPTSLLDLGCGYGGLLQHLQTAAHAHIDYTGIDLSEKMITTAKTLFPENNFFVHDILKSPLPHNSYDYVVMNGIFTEKQSLSWEAMRAFACALMIAAFNISRQGIAFNVMRHQVDWYAPHLFYWPYDDLAQFLHTTCSRHFIIRADYGLYEYSVYVYKQASFP